MYVSIQGGGLDGYVFFCDNLYRGFSFLIFFFSQFLNLVCMFITINLNAFVIALMFFYIFF